MMRAIVIADIIVYDNVPDGASACNVTKEWESVMGSL